MVGDEQCPSVRRNVPKTFDMDFPTERGLPMNVGLFPGWICLREIWTSDAVALVADALALMEQGHISGRPGIG
jgi:hypothetical protein